MFLLSILPATVIVLFIGIKKGIRKNNILTIIKLFVFGIVSMVAAAYFGLWITDNVFPVFDTKGAFFLFINNLFFVGMVEESLKFIALKLGIRKRTDKSDQMAMIVYAVMAALGFATVENYFYLENKTMVLVIARALFSVPAHASYGALMGYFLGRAERCTPEDKSSARLFRIEAIVIPGAVHGLADMFFDFSEFSWLFVLVGIALIIVNYVFVIRIIKKLQNSREDDSVFKDEINEVPEYSEELK